MNQSDYPADSRTAVGACGDGESPSVWPRDGTLNPHAQGVAGYDPASLYWFHLLLSGLRDIPLPIETSSSGHRGQLLGWQHNRRWSLRPPGELD